MQYEQCPHALPSHAMATRSPTLCRLAPGPVSSIMPTPSRPGVNGGFGLTGQSPGGGVDVGVAQAGGLHPDQDLAGAGLEGREVP